MSQDTCPPSLSSATPLFSDLELTPTTTQSRYASCRWRRWRYVSAPSSRYMAPLAVWKVTVMFYEATGT